MLLPATLHLNNNLMEKSSCSCNKSAHSHQAPKAAAAEAAYVLGSIHVSFATVDAEHEFMALAASQESARGDAMLHAVLS